MNQKKRKYAFWTFVLIWSIQVLHMVVPHHMQDHYQPCSDQLCHDHVAGNIAQIDHHHHSDHHHHICYAPLINGTRAELLSITEPSNREKGEEYTCTTDLFNPYSAIAFAPLAYQVHQFKGTLQEGLSASILYRGPPVLS